MHVSFVFLVFFMSAFIFTIPYANHCFAHSEDKVNIRVSFANNTEKNYTLVVEKEQNFTFMQKNILDASDSHRFNLFSYTLDGSQPIEITRKSFGNFTLNMNTSSDHEIVLFAKSQFKVQENQTNLIQYEPSSQTNDGWFDEGSNIQFIVPYILKVNQEETRKQLSGWSLDKDYTNVITREEFGNFKSPFIQITSSKSIILQYTQQYNIRAVSSFGKTLGSGWYDADTIANISVIPNEDPITGHVFLGWQGSTVGGSDQETVNVMVDSPKILVANWSEDYTKMSMLGILIVAALVVFIIYHKRKNNTI